MGYIVPTKEKLLKLQKRYKTDRAIGEQFGVTRQAVHLWRVKYGVRSLRELIEARNYQIKKDFKAGIPIKKLVKKYEVCMSLIYRVIK